MNSNVNMEITSVTLLRNKCPLGKGSNDLGTKFRDLISVMAILGDSWKLDDEYVAYKEVNKVLGCFLGDVIEVLEVLGSSSLCHWANPFKDFEYSNVPRVKLSSFSKSDDSFTSLQALSNLYYLLGSFMDYLWSCKLNISNFGPADRKILPMFQDDMPYSCLIEYPKHFVMISRIWM
ncbi:hypothetical protein Tco_0468810 [Tanacetum coccineum]